MHQAAREIELWLATARPTPPSRGSKWPTDAPDRASVSAALRRRAGEALIEAGRRLLPAAEPRRSRAY